MVLPEQGDRKKFPCGAQLLDVDEQIHVVVAFRRHIEPQLQVSCQLRILFKAVIETHLSGQTVIACLCFPGHRFCLHGIVGRIQVQFFVSGPFQREGLFRTVGLVVELSHILNLDPDLRSQLPAVALQL